MIAHDPDVFQQSVEVSLRRLDTIRGRLYAEFSAVATAVDATPDRVETDHPGVDGPRIMGGATGVPTDTTTNQRGVGEMVRSGALYFTIIGTAVAGLAFGSEMVRYLMAAGLVIVAGPLWVDIRRSLEALGIARAAEAIRRPAGYAPPAPAARPPADSRSADRQLG